MIKKKIVLIGASGFVGSALLKEAIIRGHPVKAVVRNPENIRIKDPNLIIVKGDASSVEFVSKTCYGSDTVISAYNPGWGNPDIAFEILRVYPAILEGVKKSGVRRFLVAGGAGSLFISKGVRLMDTGAIPGKVLPAVRSLASFYLDILTRETEVDWVFFSPAGSFIKGKRTGKYRLGKDDLIKDMEGNSHISVEDYAVAMLDEAERPMHHFERFTIGY